MSSRLRRLLLTSCLLVLPMSTRAAAQTDIASSLRARGGLSYFQDSQDSQLGALYGLDMAIATLEQSNIYASFTHNHFDLGSQFLGTVGGYRQGQADGDLLQRLSGGLLFDQYTDTRFDGLYLSQFRYFVGYALTENLGAGVTYTDPLEDADSLTVALPGGGTGPLTLRNAELVEGYLSLRLYDTLLTAALGQRQDPNELVASLYAARQISSQLSLFTNTSYTDSTTWAATWGLQWTFGTGPRRSRPGLLSTIEETTPTIVRAQNRGRRNSPYGDPSLGHNLNFDAQRFGSLITTSSPSVGTTTLDAAALSTSVPSTSAPGTSTPNTSARSANRSIQPVGFIPAGEAGPRVSVEEAQHGGGFLATDGEPDDVAPVFPNKPLIN